VLVLVPAAIVKFNENCRDATKLTKNEAIALLLRCYSVDTVTLLTKEKKPLFTLKLQEGDRLPAVVAAGTDSSCGYSSYEYDGYSNGGYSYNKPSLRVI
jgi:hypothetical protein